MYIRVNPNILASALKGRYENPKRLPAALDLSVSAGSRPAVSATYAAALQAVGGSPYLVSDIQIIQMIGSGDGSLRAQEEERERIAHAHNLSVCKAYHRLLAAAAFTRAPEVSLWDTDPLLALSWFHAQLKLVFDVKSPTHRRCLATASRTADSTTFVNMPSGMWALAVIRTVLATEILLNPPHALLSKHSKGMKLAIEAMLAVDADDDVIRYLDARGQTETENVLSGCFETKETDL